MAKESQSESTFVFNLSEEFQTATTDSISGFLDGIIVDSTDKVSIIVKSTLGYLLFHEREHNGIKYYAPRAHQIAPERKLLHPYQFDKFLINEALEIIISGPKKTKVKVTLRFS